MNPSRRASVYVHGKLAGHLEEVEKGKKYIFKYLSDYTGPAVSLTMPTTKKEYVYEGFPPYFDGVLPEGLQLDGLLKQVKLDRKDYFGQLLAVGGELIGAVTVKEEQ